MTRRSIPFACIALLCAIGATPARATTHGPVVALDANRSNNWSGYDQGALTHSLYHDVAGSWTVPAATQHTARRAESSSVWIGIGGGCSMDDCTTSDNTLIQAGTEQDVDTAGRASYAAWYELIPAPSLQITNVSVHPGDRMHASIDEVIPGLWTIVVKNLTLGQTFSTTVPYASTYGSAEWIVETPLVFGVSGAGFAAMPNLSTVSFTGASANNAPAGLRASQEMQLVDATTGAVIATPSAPGSSGTSFTVCTYATSC